jgi:RimJ/RimL family protein N-acetyltransferase
MDKTYQVSFDGKICKIESEQQILADMNVTVVDQKLMLVLNQKNTIFLDEFSLKIAIEHLLSLFSFIRTIGIQTELNVDYESAFSYFWREPGFYSLSTEEFFQLPGLWLKKGDFRVVPEVATKTCDRVHPGRPLVRSGYAYKRYNPQIDKTIAFRTADLDEDLLRFYEWNHQPRVSEFWELNQSKDDLSEYLKKGLSDPHQIPMIVELNNVPIGYFEMYWVPEDRLGPYYECDSYDRGFHFLIGNTDYLGFNYTDAVIKAALHFLFLDEPRTKRIMAEPRYDNHRILKYVDAIPAWKRIKEFDFPHKRAVLLECERGAFFSGHFL